MTRIATGRKPTQETYQAPTLCPSAIRPEPRLANKWGQSFAG
jgi:hypothetical protein